MALAAAAVAVVAGAGTSPATAVTTTTSQVIPGVGWTYAVDCPTETTCYALGNFLAGTGGTALITITNGVPGPVLAVPEGLSDLDCPTSTTCYALRGNSLVTITNGVPGPAQPIPGALGLTSIACSSASSCVAAGSFTSEGINYGIVVPITDGVPGAVQTFPGIDWLRDLACTTADTCYAVGQWAPDPVNDPFSQFGVLVPITDGLAGAPQVVPGTGDLIAVGCSSPTTCYAAGSGDFFAGFFGTVVVPITDGTPGTPEMVGVDVLTAIDCLSATTCEAVGFSGMNAAVVPIVDGIPGTPHLVTEGNALYDVACNTPTSCVAVGLYSPTPGTNLGVVVTITETTVVPTTTTVAPTTTTVAPTTTTVAPTTTTTEAPGSMPTSRDQCKNGGYENFGFRNQGQCVSFVASEGRSGGRA